MEDIRRYVSAEMGASYDLMFGQTAQIGRISFWVWGLVDSSGDTIYVDVSTDGRTALLGSGSGEGLTVSQYVALRYVRRWRNRP